MKTVIYHLTWPLVFLSTQVIICQGITPNYGEAVSNNQLATSGAEGVLTELWLKSLGSTNNLLDENTIQGSPYFNAEFRQGSLYYDDELQGTFPMRYNAFRDQIQLKPDSVNDTVRIGLIRDHRLSCVLDGKRLFYERFRDRSNTQQSGYLFGLIESNKGIFYQRKIKRFMEGKASSNSLTREVPPRFIDQFEFYFQSSDKDQIIEIPSNRKKAAALLAPEHTSELLKFIRKNRLRTNDEQDLILISRQMDILGG